MLKWHGGGMAGKLRHEYAGAMYHVINRGNYRACKFQEEKTKTARWELALEVALRCLAQKVRASTLKSAAWKVAVARHRKETTNVSNGWLANDSRRACSSTSASMLA